MKRALTQIICTVGPKSDTVKVMKGLIKAGATALRINLSHTPLERTMELLKRMRKTSKTIPIIIDTQGKETRMMAPEAHAVMLSKKETVLVVPFGTKTNGKSLWASRYDVIKVLPRNTKIFIDDNRIALKVISHVKGKISTTECVVVTGGEISVAKNISLEKKIEPKSMLTDIDRAVIKKALAYNIAEVSLSYVSSAKDIQETRKFIGKKSVRVTSKIETAKALKNLDELIKASDAIFIDRNDLGTEIGYEKIPLVQKFVTKRCLKAKSDIFVATHILENMITKDKPTRGEVNDIINLVLDGVTGLVLSSETAVGKNPVKIVATLKKLVAQGEFILQQQTEGSGDVIERLTELNYL